MSGTTAGINIFSERRRKKKFEQKISDPGKAKCILSPAWIGEFAVYIICRLSYPRAMHLVNYDPAADGDGSEQTGI